MFTKIHRFSGMQSFEIIYFYDSDQFFTEQHHLHLMPNKISFIINKCFK